MQTDLKRHRRKKERIKPENHQERGMHQVAPSLNRQNVGLMFYFSMRFNVENIQFNDMFNLFFLDSKFLRGKNSRLFVLKTILLTHSFPKCDIGCFCPTRSIIMRVLSITVICACVRDLRSDH